MQNQRIVRSQVGMAPYSEYVEALVTERDPMPAINKLCRLPLNKRYAWRAVKALHDALANLEMVDIEVDRETMSPEELTKLAEFLYAELTQVYRFFEVLIGCDLLEASCVKKLQKRMKLMELLKN